LKSSSGGGFIHVSVTPRGEHVAVVDHLLSTLAELRGGIVDVHAVR
jgi:hypothetical protein